MDCDLCGKTATAKAMVEGAQLTVCGDCAKHGQNVRSLPQAPMKKSSKAVIQQPKEELIESVRPDIAKLLHQHREKLKLTQEQFASKLQIRASTYNHYESGAVVPDIATARKLEHVLKLPLVVHIRMASNETKQEIGRGMTFGDFVKK